MHEKIYVKCVKKYCLFFEKAFSSQITKTGESRRASK